MQEQAIDWSAIAIVGSIFLGAVLVNLGLHWRDKQHRRRARGFRNMKSMAQQQRERARRPDWRQAPRATHRGWR